MSLGDFGYLLDTNQLGLPEAKTSLTPQSFQGSEEEAARTTIGFGHPESLCVCKFCGRRFDENRIDKHESACEFASKKRPIFNMKRKQFPHIEFIESLSQTRRTSQMGKFTNTRWHQQHEDVINNLRFGRIMQSLEERGEDTSKLSPPPSLMTDYATCPHCFRKFGPSAAERHIEKCKDIVNKPSPPPGLENNFALPNIHKPSKSPQPTLPGKKTNTSMRKFISPTLECPHCYRHFAPRAAERHIPICEKVRNKPRMRKPSNLFTNKEIKRSFRVIKKNHCEGCFAVLPAGAFFCVMCGCKQ